MSAVDDEEDDIDDGGAAPPRLLPLGVASADEHVMGYPLHAAITLAAEDQGAVLKRLPRISFFSLEGAVGAVFLDGVTHERRAGDIPAPPVGRDPEERGMDVFGDAPQRILVDLWPLPRSVTGEALSPGRYEMTIVYASASGRAESAPVPIMLREPSPEERDILDSLAPELARAGSWSAWCKQPPADPEALRGPFAKSDPLRYCRVLRYLYHGEPDLADANAAFIDVLDGLYAPEADLLRAEIAKAQGDAARMAQHLASALAAAPGLFGWAAEIEGGRSDLQWTNAERRKKRAAPR